MLPLIICTAIGGVLIILSIILLTGRGAFLIAGYNTKSKSEKEEYDVPALCRFMGKILLPLALLIILIGIERLHEFSWFIPAWMIITIGVVTFTIVYANTGNRFKR